MPLYHLLAIEDKKKWNEFLYKLPAEQQDVYFTPEYYSLYQHYGDGKAQCFIYEEGDNMVLYPFFINSVNALGYKLDGDYFDIQGAYGYNGIVTSYRGETFISNFHNCFDKFCCNNNIIAEFSRFHPLLRNYKLASPLMKTIYSRKTVYLNLTISMNDIWMKQFTSANRNVIRKAEKDGVSIVESEDYTTFYDLYNGTMQNVHAEDYYFFPQEYFNEYCETLKGNSILCFAIYKGKVIAGAMFMFSKNYAHYHLSARDNDFYKIAANNLILQYGIEKAKERGCKKFHFGGGTTGEENDSLLMFKQKYSKDNGLFYIGKRVHNQNIYDQIVFQWKEQYPGSYKQNNNRILGYREII